MDSLLFMKHKISELNITTFSGALMSKNTRVYVEYPQQPVRS